MTSDYAIVPVRSFATTKLRLKGDLSSDKRATLTATLLSRVARAIERSQVGLTVVVASDPEEALTCLEGISKTSVIGEDLPNGGVNRAMRTGIDFATKKGAKTVMLLPSDLPIIVHSKINEVLELLKSYDLVINPSLRKDGTNLLALKTPLRFELHYDDHSFEKHTEEARFNNLDFISVYWREFSADLDDSSDLEAAMKYYGSKSFEEFIENLSASET
jgi:2-phospho-L-lactate guanylyltransferase